MKLNCYKTYILTKKRNKISKHSGGNAIEILLKRLNVRKIKD